MDLGLKSLKALLVGATKGIGRATAEVLVEEGCKVALCARNAQEVAQTLAALRARGGVVVGEAADAADAAAYRDWIARSAQELGGCDIFISFASGGGGPPSEDTWRAAFDLDLMATARGVEAALPYLSSSSAGSIVAIASTAAFEDFLAPQPYAAMKAAVINYAAALSRSLAPSGVRVNCVSPGPIFVAGGSWDKIKTAMPPIYESTLNAIPMGRMGEAMEIARAIAFIASPACRFMTGANVVIDGAFTKRVQY